MKETKKFFISIFRRTLRLLPNYRHYTTFNVLKTRIHTIWIAPEFKVTGSMVSIGYPLNLRGGKYITIGNNVGIGKRVVLNAWDRHGDARYTPDITIGNNSYIGDDGHITSINAVIIGNNVLTGRKILITDNSHGKVDASELALSPAQRPLYSKGPVIIEDGVWIGEKVTILPGVTIGENSVIGANSVVTKDIPANCVAGGIPAVVIKIYCPSFNMSLIIPIIYVFLFSILACSLFSLRWSMALYVAYMILVPTLEFKLLGIPFSYNLVNTILLISFIYHFRIRSKLTVDYKGIKPFIILYLSLLALSLYSWDTPWAIQFSYWRISFMKTCFISFILWNILLYEPKAFRLIAVSFALAILIAGLYGLFLTQLAGQNPYTSFISAYFNLVDSAKIYSTQESRLTFSNAGKIQSTMIHPMTWSLVLCLLTVIFSALISNRAKLKYLFWLVLILALSNLLVSGVRTGVAALIIGLTYFVIWKGQFKLLVWGIVGLSVSYIIVLANDDLYNLFSSLVDVSGTKSNVSGSSIQMRVNQFEGALYEIRNSWLVGKGYGWNIYYGETRGNHPVLLAFESLIFVVLCNSGVVGACIWITFFILLFKTQRQILKNKNDIVWADTMVLVYIAYCIGTGEYGYIQFFALYYVFLLAYLFKQRSISKQLS